MIERPSDKTKPSEVSGRWTTVSPGRSPATEPDRAGDAQLALVLLEQVDDGHVDVERRHRAHGHVIEQHLGVARVDRQPAELREVLVVVSALQRLLHARVGADVADRSDDERQPVVLQRAQRDLDHDLAAVLAPGDEFGLLAHGPGPRLSREGAAVGRVLRTNVVGYQLVDLQAHQLVDRVAEQRRRRRIGENDAAARRR